VRYLFLICLYTLPFFASCQNVLSEAGIIRGHIFFKFGKTDTLAIQGAIVTLEVPSASNTYQTKISNVNGEFTLIIPDSLNRKRFKIRIRCVGCTEKVIVVKKEQLPINDLRIAIVPFVNNDDFE